MKHVRSLAMTDVLTGLANRPRCSTRSTARWPGIGGDELAILLAACSHGDVEQATERLRLAVAERMGELCWPITASVGAVRFNASPDGVGHALALADANMYAAKLAGKNRAVFSEYPPTGTA